MTPASGSAAAVGGIQGEGSDFSGRRFVWVRDPEKAFVKGEVVLDEDGTLTVRCDDGAVSTAVCPETRVVPMLTSLLGTDGPGGYRGQGQSCKV